MTATARFATVAAMFFSFVDELRKAGIPASIKEHLTLLEALDAEVIGSRPEEFYWLARATFVKDEGLLDRFDQVFARVFKGIAGEYGTEAVPIPEEWLRKIAELYLTPEQMAEIQSLGSWEEIMETLKQRLAEQQGRHQGGSKWIGTGGTSPFGAYGYNPEGIRIGQEGSRNRSAIKVWDKREFRNLDSAIELGTRNIKVALRRLRRFAREGAADELDIDGTIDGTARKGWLDIRMRPERHNAVKLLLFLDVGGSMDPHIKLCEELFSAATSEFKNLEFFYFHNCLYESVWKDNRRRFSERTPTWDVLHKYGHDYKFVFVGDAAMSPYEISHPGGAIEHFNEEAGAVWMKRVTNTYPSAVWLNPTPEQYWGYSASTGLIRDLMQDRMYPLTLAGLDEAMRSLTRKA
ncbi:MAG: domain containing CoxE-like family protein [Alphaproteobacteria bacterium]|nr:domain containing CoxE-like family protein [Alphaproteobacteria bacterium]